MSGTLKLYKEWLKTATPEQIAFVDEVYELCAKHYEDGGSTVLECFEPEEVIEKFKTTEDVRRFCGLRAEHATNFREGTDNDPELKTLRNFEENWK